jgi:peptidoglycan/LPS O-acetylase OafA/YrhL
MSPLQLENYPLLAITYGVILYVAMLAIAVVATRFSPVVANLTIDRGRYGALDGFRGVLAIGVFVHHSFTAYKYFTLGVWDWSLSPILNHLGQTSVAIFFMITGFLFALKAMSPRIDWIAFYLARFTRLFPLYSIIVCAVFIIVFIISKGEMKESIEMILKELIQWLTFSLFDRPDVNGLPKTWTLIAGVNWTLKYEIQFYAIGVPLLFLLFRIFGVRKILTGSAALLSYLLVAGFVHEDMDTEKLLYTHFLCGIVTACAYQEFAFLKVIKSQPFHWAAGLSVLLFCWLINSSSSWAIVLTMTLFTAVIGRLSLWGLFNTRAARWLGDISYGVYLIHGLVLWLTLTAVKSYGNLSQMNLFSYGCLMLVVGIVVVGLASLSYIKLEKPLMALVSRRSTHSKASLD